MNGQLSWSTGGGCLTSQGPTGNRVELHPCNNTLQQQRFKYGIFVGVSGVVGIFFTQKGTICQFFKNNQFSDRKKVITIIFFPEKGFKGAVFIEH